MKERERDILKRQKIINIQNWLKQYSYSPKIYTERKRDILKRQRIINIQNWLRQHSCSPKIYREREREREREMLIETKNYRFTKLTK